MGLIVQKFGGSSVKDRDRIFNVARIVMNTRNAGNDVVVVVSAQGDTTDDLITKAAEITSDPSHREMDMLLAAGEEISISLLTMALQELGVSAISLTGWQAGFNTDRAYSKARIKRLDTERVESAVSALKNATSRIGGGDVTVDKGCAKVSIVGAGMQSHSGVASTMFEALFNQNINIKMISTSEIKISVIIDEEDADKAVAAIHDAFIN